MGHSRQTRILRMRAFIFAALVFLTPVVPSFAQVEAFISGDAFDLSNTTLTFALDGSEAFYSVCSTVAHSFPTDPSGGESVLAGEDDASFEAILSGGARFPFYGQNYPSVFIGTNGFLTFGTADSSYSQSLVEHFSRPRVAALFLDLALYSLSNVSWKQLIDRVVVTYESISEFEYESIQNNFQIELFFDGIIRITYLSMDSTSGIVGLSEGLGLPLDFVEMDLSGSPSCVVRSSSNLIRGVVLDRVSQVPIEGALVTLEPGFRTQRTNEFGDFVITNLPDDSYTVSVFAAGFAAESKDFTVSNGQTVIFDFNLDATAGSGPLEGSGDGTGEGELGGGGAFTLTGLVTDAVTGLPPGCVTVVATGFEGLPRVVSTDLTGRYVFDEIPVETYVLSVFAPGYLPNVDFVNPPGGGETTADFPLESRPASGLIFGTVNSQENESEGPEPLSGVKVNALVGGVLFDTTYSCANGSFEIAVPGTKGLNVTLEFEADGFNIGTVENPTDDLVIELEPKIFVSGFIAGLVLAQATGAPVGDANVWVGFKGQTALTFPRLTSSVGTYIVGNLGPGEYEVKVQAAGFEPSARTVSKSMSDLGLSVDFEILAEGQVGEGSGEGAADGEIDVVACAAPRRGTSEAFRTDRIAGDLLLLSLVAIVLCRAQRRRVRRGPRPAAS